MPFRTSFRRIRLSANEADCPAEQTGTGIRFRSIDLMWVDVNWPRESGPMRTGSPAWTTPWKMSEGAPPMLESATEHTALDHARHYGSHKGH